MPFVLCCRASTCIDSPRRMTLSAHVVVCRSCDGAEGSMFADNGMASCRCTSGESAFSALQGSWEPFGSSLSALKFGMRLSIKKRKLQIATGDGRTCRGSPKSIGQGYQKYYFVSLWQCACCFSYAADFARKCSCSFRRAGPDRPRSLVRCRAIPGGWH